MSDITSFGTHFTDEEIDDAFEPKALRGAKTMRKVIHICAAGTAHVLYALCNDGTIWFLAKATNGWLRLPEIPQGRDDWGQQGGGPQEGQDA